MALLQKAENVAVLAGLALGGFFLWKNWDAIKGLFGQGEGDTTRPDGTTTTDPCAGLSGVPKILCEMGRSLLGESLDPQVPGSTSNYGGTVTGKVPLSGTCYKKLIDAPTGNYIQDTSGNWCAIAGTGASLTEGERKCIQEAVNLPGFSTENPAHMAAIKAQCTGKGVAPTTAGTAADPAAALAPSGYYEKNPVGAWCEKTKSYVNDPASCADYLGTGSRVVELAPGVNWDTPNVVLAPYRESCGLKYSQDGVFALPMPDTCAGRAVCPPGMVPTTCGAAGMPDGCNDNSNTYAGRGRQICVGRSPTGRFTAYPPNPGCDYMADYLKKHNCGGV